MIVSFASLLWVAVPRAVYRSHGRLEKKVAALLFVYRACDSVWVHRSQGELLTVFVQESLCGLRITRRVRRFVHAPGVLSYELGRFGTDVPWSKTKDDVLHWRCLVWSSCHGLDE
jgi:hypothetical protein